MKNIERSILLVHKGIKSHPGTKKNSSLVLDLTGRRKDKHKFKGRKIHMPKSSLLGKTYRIFLFLIIIFKVQINHE